MSTHDGISVLTPVSAWTAALNRHDASAVADAFAPDAEFTDAGTGYTSTGRPAIRETVQGLLAVFTDLTVEKTNTLCDGPRYATEWVMTGIHSGDLPGMPATGRSFRVMGAGLGVVHEGLILRATEYWNMADLLAQVGLLPLNR